MPHMPRMQVQLQGGGVCQPAWQCPPARRRRSMKSWGQSGGQRLGEAGAAPNVVPLPPSPPSSPCHLPLQSVPGLGNRCSLPLQSQQRYRARGLGAEGRNEVFIWVCRLRGACLLHVVPGQFLFLHQTAMPTCLKMPHLCSSWSIPTLPTICLQKLIWQEAVLYVSTCALACAGGSAGGAPCWASGRHGCSGCGSSHCSPG